LVTSEQRNSMATKKTVKKTTKKTVKAPNKPVEAIKPDRLSDALVVLEDCLEASLGAFNHSMLSRNAENGYKLACIVNAIKALK